MDIAVIGLSYQTAPVEVREKASFADSKKIELIDELLQKASEELIILSTCNRSEIYIASQNIQDAIGDVYTMLRNSLGEEPKPFIYIKTNKKAISHLFHVAAGLKSIVIGEDQILGQVKDAHRFAMEMGASGKVFNKLFREAITCGKLIRKQLKISEYPLSISSIGVKFIREKLGTLKNKKILVLGAGKMSALALKYLTLEEPDTVYIVNRTFCKAKELSTSLQQAQPIDFHKRYEIMKEVDVVITSTASPHLIIEKAHMTTYHKPLIILDLAVPRDVESSVGSLDGVYLYDIDALEEVSSQNSAKRERLAQQASGIVEAYVDAYRVWLDKIKIDPVIQSLHEKCYTIHKDSMHYIENKLELTQRERKIIDKMMMASLKRLIREPVKILKETDDTTKQEAYVQILHELFDIE